MKKKIFLIIIFFLFIVKVDGLTYGGCEYSDVSKLKSLVENINISYSYHEVDNVPYIDVTINNIVSDMYFVDNYNRKTYYYSDTNNGEITIRDYSSNGESYSYRFYSARNDCYGISLGSKYYSLPKYNYYYNNSMCSGLENFSLCQKWAKINYSSSEMEDLIYKYKNKEVIEDNEEENVIYKKSILDTVFEYYATYYYYFFLVLIIVCGIIIIINRRKDRIKSL